MIRPGVIVIEGHVQGLSNTRALGEAGIPVIVIDVNNCIARYSKHCTKFFYCPKFDSHDFIAFLVELTKNENLDGWILLPSNDHIIENISGNKNEIDKYYKTTIPSIELLEKIINKKELISIASKINIPVPKTYDVNNYSANLNQLKFPVLVKGVKGLSFYKKMHSKAILIKTNEELTGLMNSTFIKDISKNVMIQELIPFDPTHKVISFTSFCINGKIECFWIGEKIREHPVKYGTATFARSISNEICFIQSTSLLKELDFTGVCEIEYLFDPHDKTFKLIEINPRTWLWVGLAKACGINYPLMLYNYLNGIPYDYPKNYIIGLKWINYFTDSVYSFISLLKGNLRFKEYARSFKGKKINAVFSWNDLLPGIVFPFMIFFIARKRG